ncbi:MAG TPA: tyrosine-type recombinase/integrase [Acidimicrobiales bacterium]|nr:tyrosine-type recombinase/integrase [Acidimicrobiales bacterium]
MSNRAASAAPRKDEATGTWWFVCDLPPGPEGQRRQAKRRGFPTKKSAQEELDRLRNRVATATYVAPKRQTLAEYLTADWLPALRRELAASTWESYDRNVRLHVVPRIGGIQLQKVDGPLLDRFYADLLETGRRLGKQMPGLKPRTVRYIHTILSGAFDYAVRQQRLVINPATRATPPSAASAKAPEMRTWSAQQLRRFLDLCEGDRYYWPFAFLALTGCRRGEVLGLRWRDLDLESAPARASIRQTVIPLTKATGKGREGRILPRTKSDKARVIELDAATVAMLRKWNARQKEERMALGAGYGDHDLIFCRPDGRPYHPEAFSKTFDRRLHQERFAELPTIRLHDLRHTWATLALAAGVDVAIVSKRLGHGSPMTTWQTYQHVVAGMQTDAAEKVAALIFGGAS